MFIVHFLLGMIFAIALIFIFQGVPLILNKRIKKNFDATPVAETSNVNDPMVTNGLLAFSLTQDADFLESQRNVVSKNHHNNLDDCIADMNLAAERLGVGLHYEEAFDPSQVRREIKFLYTNYRGEQALRRAIIIGTRWGNTEWHPEHGFLLRAYDLDKQEIREFALKDCDFTQKTW